MSFDQKNVLCLYHGDGCLDGFGAAWAVHEALPNAEFMPVEYNKPIPQVTDRDVLIVDFSYSQEATVLIGAKAHSLLVLDHHKSAAEALVHLRPPDVWLTGWPSDYQVHCEDRCQNAIFDMNRSGAMLAWNFFHPREPAPLFIEYIQDRDLWTKKLKGVDEFTAALRSYPQDFAVWDDLATGTVAVLIKEGQAIMRAFRSQVDFIKRSAFDATLCIYDKPMQKVRIANAPRLFSSEVAGEIADPIGATFCQRLDGQWEYSLRSSSVDVAEICKWFGGGGHAKAAGFVTRSPMHVRLAPA